MEFTAMGTIWVRGGKPVVEVEGNFYDVRKEDMRKIVGMRQAQGFSSLKDALHGAEAKFKIVREAKKALLIELFEPAPDNELTVDQTNALYEYVNAPTRYVEFIHSSLMSESEEEEYIFLDGVWQTIDPTSKFAATKFEEGEIHSPIYWA